MASWATWLLILGWLLARAMRETGPCISQLLAGWLRLIYMAMMALSKRANRNVQGLLRPKPGNGIVISATFSWSE